MPAKFVIKQGTTGKFRFTLCSNNGQVIATSQAYNSKAACLNGVRAVQKSAAGAESEDQTTKAWAAAEQARKAAKKGPLKKAAAKKSAVKKAAAKKSV
ncbi:MAG: YegP family protein [Acidimicrobiales bacterium]